MNDSPHPTDHPLPLSTIARHHLQIPAATRELEHIRNFVSGHARRFGFPEQAVDDIRLAVDEACTNIIKHAYESRKGQEIRVFVEVYPREMVFSIIDSGKPFDPANYPVPTLQEQLQQKKRGGYGLVLMRRLMDRVEYHKTNSHNELRLTKRL